jgi:hypothetical protein
MKNLASLIKKIYWTFLLQIVFVFGVVINGHSQYLQLYNNAGQSVLFQSNFTNNPSIIGLNALSFTTNPLFNVEIKNGFGKSLGSIQQMVTLNNQNYGILQTASSVASSNGTSLANYLQNRLCIGTDIFTEMLGIQGDIGLLKSDGNDTIHFNIHNVAGSVPTIAFRFHDTQITGTPLTINNSMVTTQFLQTRSFQITTNPGLNKILVSDAEGIASWADPSGWIPDYWQQINGNVYLNSKYNNVGIGTNNPAQALHVVDGNILISATTVGTTGVGGGGSTDGTDAPHKGPKQSNGVLAPNSKNGSILFGDAITQKNTLGEWGIEYATNNTDYNSNGLNFWKPYSCANPGNDFIFIRNDGNIGIGTENTCGYKLAVKGKILCSELHVIDISEFCDYVFNKSYNLMSIKDLDKFIDLNHHLPEVPTASEVKENGLSLGEMNKTLLKKVEELTLYIIQQQKQIDQQTKQIEDIKAEINKK